MKKSYALPWIAMLAFLILISGCNRKDQKADIPDIESIYDNISYLDSLVRSDQTDSIGKIKDHISVTILQYISRAQSPEDKAILDSLNRINSVTSDFLRLCNDTRTNLELLQQDTKALESQYRTGKIKIAIYVSSLLEEEQILIDLNDQVSSKYEVAKQYLKNQSLLINRLNPLPD
jgi:hypothetical protein